MENKRSVKKNFIYNSLYQFLLMITPLITSPYVSRVLGSEGIGVYSYTYSIASCFALVGMLGVTNYGNRSIATVQDDKEKRSKIFWNIFLLQLLTTMAVLIIYGIYILILCPAQYKIVSLLQTLTVLCSLCDINWYFFGVEKFKLTVTRNTIIKILNVICIFLFVHSSNDILIYTFILVGSMFLSNVVLWPFMRKEVNLVKPSFKEMQSHLQQMVILFIPVIAITLYKRMDKVMLGVMSSMSQTGFYENTEKIISIPNSLIAALGTVMLPRMTNLFANGKSEEANRYLNMSMEFVCFMAVALMFGIAGIANEFAPLFFGSEFAHVGQLIMVISPTVFFISWANVIRTQYLIPLHFDKIYVTSVWIGAVVNLVLNFIFIPFLGALGAVIGTDVAEAVVMLYQTFKVRKDLPIATYLKNTVWFFISGIIMFIAVRIIGITVGIGLKGVILEAFCGGVIYLFLTIPYIMKKHSITISMIIVYVRGIIYGNN